VARSACFKQLRPKSTASSAPYSSHIHDNPKAHLDAGTIIAIAFVALVVGTFVITIIWCIAQHKIDRRRVAAANRADTRAETISFEELPSYSEAVGAVPKVGPRVP
jgi:hypothetical protein